MIENAEPVLVQRTHHLRPLPVQPGLFALRKPAPRPGSELVLPGWIKLSETYPEIRPLRIGMVKKKRIAAVVRTTGAGKNQLPRHPLIFQLELPVNIFQLMHQRNGKNHFLHSISSARHWT
ncbi:MAG: hypothetical protein ACD_75C00145G0003 [uncultured bacterium]|nr:MAG: hypothetical protein ACD_75C00145G0003 [uncultured bacterium]